MSWYELTVLGIAGLTALACALPGVLLVLRRMALVSDAISHTVVLGIVLMFFIVKRVDSPWLFFGAAATGVLTVSLIEVLKRSGRLREDAAIGLVFPALFSLAVILISRYASQVHLDTDAVLLGELAFAPLNRWVVNGRDLGPLGLWQTGGLLLANALVIRLFYKEFKLSTFDPGLAAALGFAPVLLNYLLVSLVSLTAVGSFDAVGAVLVVALMIAPPAAAYLLTDRLPAMFGLAALFGLLSAFAGFFAAKWLNVSISGMMALVAGVLFAGALVFSPRHGLLAQVLRQRRQRWELAERMLAVHLLQHEGTPQQADESELAHIAEVQHWQQRFFEHVVERAIELGLVSRQGTRLDLTETGRSLARSLLAG